VTNVNGRVEALWPRTPMIEQSGLDVLNAVLADRKEEVL
jgi:hypothetical protein